ncbi:MAG: hypothetical protein JSR17_06950 [Proteobacteria bacterium]|nr:hypothetical protein [Pseudomonadota bacterium]
MKRGLGFHCDTSFNLLLLKGVSLQFAGRLYHCHTGFWDALINYPHYYQINVGDLTDVSVKMIVNPNAAAHYIQTRI